MKILPRTLSRKTITPARIVLFTVISACSLAPITLPGLNSSAYTAYAQESTNSGHAPKSTRNKISKKQQQNIIEKNVRIRKLQEGIIDQKIKILDSKKQERNLLGELEKIENDLKIQKNMLSILQKDSAKQELLLSDKQEYLRGVLAEKKAHQVHVKNRLAAYYRMGSVGVMNVVFSAESLPKLLDFQEYFGRMVQYDHTLIQKYLTQLKESNRAREEHAREKLRLMKLADEVKEKENQLNRIREEKNFLLKQVNTEQHLYELAVLEIEEAAADLAATLQRLEKAAEPPPASVQPSSKSKSQKKKKPPQKKPAAPKGFPAQKGLLDPPVMGTVIIHFKQKITGKFDSSTISSGIDIKVKKNVEIKAVYDGKIIHSGYLRGYGNLIIIDHGQQYFSLISRAADFYKKEGTKVATGEIIGITGENDPLYGEGLHFEIRKGSSQEDPLLWIKKNALPLEDPTREAQ